MKSCILLVLVAFLCTQISLCNSKCTTTPPGGCVLPPGGIVCRNCTRPHEFHGCGSACQNECNTLNDPCPIINVRCNDLCYCIEGYARDCDCKCIPEKDCPPKYSCKKSCRRYQ